MAAIEESAAEQGSVAGAASVDAASSIDAPLALALVENPVAGAEEHARAGERSGWAAAQVDAESGDVTVAVIARPAVRMGDYHAIPFVAAMGARDAFAALGAARDTGIRWPHDLVCAASDFDKELASVSVKAGAGEGGMFAVVSVRVCSDAFAGLGLDVAAGACAADGSDENASLDEAAGENAVEAASSEVQTGAGTCDLATFAPRLAAAVLSRVESWSALLANNRAVAGPLAPVLNEYFDMVPALGHRAAAVSPNGHPLAIGTFAGVDVWGRATIKTTVDEREFAPEVARIRML